MGKMLEALKRARERHGRHEQAPALHAVWPEAGTTDETPEEEMPFVEVGGPREPSQPAAPPAQPSAPKLMTVAFRPLPEHALGHGLCAFAPELIAYHQPHHSISGQYRVLVDRLQAALPAEQARVLLFTAAAAGAGTTTVLLNAAITLARQAERRVVVVDAHLRRPALAGRLGLPEKPGLREVLAGRMKLEDVLRPTGMANLTLLSAGDTEAASPVRLAGEAMRTLLRRLREQFEMVLLDGPRWDGRPEVVALGCACDAVCLCLPEAEQHRPETNDLLQIIAEQGATLCGCVLTSR
jgi:Mrp family chromosome partitioning ATPase